MPRMGTSIGMRSGFARREDSASGVTRRVVRLFVLLGMAVAAYLVLSLFDHAARADAGSTDQPINQIGATNPVASVKATAAGAGKAIPERKSITPKSTAAKAHPQRIHRPAIKTSGVRPPKVQTPKKIRALKVQAPKIRALKVQTPKIRALKVQAPKIQAPEKIQAPRLRAGETVRRVQVRISKLRQPASDAVRDGARATVTSALTVVVRQKLPISHLPALPGLAKLPDLPRAELPALPQPQPSSWSPLPGLPQARTAALPIAPAPHQPPMPSVSAQVCPLPQLPAPAQAPGPSGVTEPPAAQAGPWTAPLPAPPRQPADRSTPTGQARDSGGGNTPAVGTVSSSWLPVAAAAGRHPATDLLARGRTVRYAGPPS